MAVVLERSTTVNNLAPEARCLFDIYRKEGDDLYCKRKYKKALISYNEALRLVNRSSQTLVARSRCYMGMGMMQKALDDTESALDINASYLPAVYQKAQIHYRQGNYEMALMTFNRGHKLNPGAPGFLEGVQKAQHAIDIMAAGRGMKTTVVGDLSLYLPKHQSSFQASKKTLPSLANKNKNGDIRLPSPGFPKRHGTLLLQVQKRPPPSLGEPKYGRDGKMARVDDKAMKEILGQLYDDKEYFERILNSSGGQRDLADMLSSVLEDGLKFLYDRVLFWAQNGSLPPSPPPPAKESSDELTKVKDAIGAVSSVNDPDTVHRKRRLRVLKRRADILKKKSSMVVVTRKKPKKAANRRSKEMEEEKTETDISKVNFQFNSLPVLQGISPRGAQQPVHQEGSRVAFVEGAANDSEEDSELLAVDEAHELREKEKEARREQKEKEEKQKDGQGGGEEEENTGKEEEKYDPLTEYLDKMMDTMEKLHQKSEYKSLKTKAESFLLTMEKYDTSVTGNKMQYVAKAHSFLGNAHVGMRQYEFALMHREKDLEIGQRWNHPVCVSRALGNIARVHVFTRKYSTALKYLAQKSKLTNTPQETAWLYHEIASCFLQLYHYHFAKDAAQKSLQAATEAQDSLYQLQSSVLLGAIQVKLQNFERAYGSFERAMDHAKLRGVIR